MLSGVYLRLAMGCRSVDVLQSIRLVEAVCDALSGRSRLIIAYRHPYGDTPFDVLVEYVQNLWDFANRLAGGAISGRRTVRPYRALLVPGMPIDLTARLARYRREKRVCVSETLADLQRSYTECISQARNQR